MDDTYSFLIVDDDAFVRQALDRVLAKEFPDARIIGVGTLEAAMGRLNEQTWSLVMLDLSLGDKSGLELVRYLRTSQNETPVLVLSAYAEQEYALPAIRAGARGFISKDDAISTPKLSEAVRKVLSGRKFISDAITEELLLGESEPQTVATGKLSAQEDRVMSHIANGKAVKEIAILMGLSEKTVRTYRTRLMEKLQLNTDGEIIRYAIQKGIVT